MNTPQDVKNWYLRDSFNSTNLETKQITYQIACSISPPLIQSLMLKQQPEQTYLGANLKINVALDGKVENNENFLVVYTYQKNQSKHLYLAGRVDYKLKNIIIKDYLDYVNSQNYYALAIDQTNFDTSIIQNTQAVKREQSVLNQTTYFETKDFVNTYKSIVDFLTMKTRTRYFTTIFAGINQYNPTPAQEIEFLSRTPSTLFFADEMEAKIASGKVCIRC